MGEKGLHRHLKHILPAFGAGCLLVGTAGAADIPTQAEFEQIIYDGDVHDTSNIISTTGEWHYAVEPWLFRDPADAGEGGGIYLAQGGTLTFNLQGLSTQV